MLKRVLSAASAALLAAVLAYAPASAQTYPTTNPVYIPTAIGSVASVASTATLPAAIVWNLNGLGTGTLELTGTYTGLSAVLQVTNDRSTSPTWVTIGSLGSGVGNGRIKLLTANGTYRFNVGGFAQAQLSISVLSTGSVNASFAGTPGPTVVDTLPPQRATYSAIITGLAPAASATDFLTIIGSATTTVYVTRVECSGTSTAAATAVVQALKRSTADTTGTSTSPGAVPHDANDPAATAVVKAYTVNPGALGTLIGSGLRSGELTTVTVATSAFQALPLVGTFGGGTGDQSEPVILRGVAQTFALNGNAASFTSGTALNCSLTWEEE